MTAPLFDAGDWRAAAAACERVDVDRIWRMHGEMARFGAIPGPGVNRQAFSAEDIGARQAVLRWLEPHPFEVFTDDIANIFIRRPGRNAAVAPIMTGSHMDSQPFGGRFDGIYGVIAGLEVLFALEESGLETEHPIDVVAWSNEEGGRFAPGAMGSMVYAGARHLEEFLNTKDADGVLLRDALAATLAAIPDAKHRQFGSPVAGYVEAHIEQGPLLEAAGRTIGIVTGIQGTRWFSVEVRGESAHAGTTPLSSRRDAFQAAISAIHELNRLVAEQPDDLRFTIGRFDVLPNTPNSVAENVSFTIDVRHPDAGVIEAVGTQVERICSGRRLGCDFKISRKFNRAPCMFPDTVVNTVERAAAGLGETHMRMVSGAFHDALFMDDICPTGMIFVPCEQGISHNPKENAAPADLAAGTRVLLASLIGLDSSL